MKRVKLAASLFVAVLFLTAVGNTMAAPVTFVTSGANPAAIQGTVDAFRTALGTLNSNVVGSFGSGRREINWDGVPDAVSSPSAFPANFFNSNSPRGVVFSTAGSGFQVSSTSAVGNVRFDNINATYSAAFQTFSAQKLFTPIGNNVMDVNFFVPGFATPAFTSGFGAVFTDVDVTSTTSLQFFDTQNNSLGTFFVPISNNGLSFLGVQFNAGEKISRVHITSGNAALGPNDAPVVTDVAVMDDFIFGEPQATPEPSSLMLMVGGLGLIGIMMRRSSVQL